MMLCDVITLYLLTAAVSASRAFLNSPETGLLELLGPNFPVGQLPNLTDLWSTHDFDWSAKNHLSKVAYNWLRYATGAEYTYRNNMEDFPRVGFKPHVLSGATGEGVNMSMETTILGNNFSAPFFISPAAAPELLVGPTIPGKELGLLKGAYEGGILYIPSIAADVTIEQFGAAKGNTSQVTFQQLYAQLNMSYNQDIMTRAKAAGSKAIVWTVDAAADGAWVRGARFTIPPRWTVYPFTWDFFHQLRNLTDLPIVLKGITNVEDAKRAVKEGADAIFLSNHGGRHLDTSPTSLQVALAIYDQAPEMFQQVEVYADGGVRYGSDILKLLALGVRAVGLGRSFMYANLCYGQAGVERTIDLLKQEIYLDAVNLGVTDLKQLNSSWLDLDFLRSHQWDQW